MLDDLARDVHVHAVGAAVAYHLGRDVAVPDWDSVRDAFDAALAEPPDAESPDTPKAIRMRALGLTVAGR